MCQRVPGCAELSRDVAEFGWLVQFVFALRHPRDIDLATMTLFRGLGVGCVMVVLLAVPSACGGASEGGTDVHGDGDGDGDGDRTPLLDGPEGGICFDPGDLGLDEWDVTCTAPRDVVSSCEFDVGWAHPQLPGQTKRRLDETGRINWEPGNFFYKGIQTLGHWQYVFDEEGNDVLKEFVTDDGCVASRIEVVPTEVGTVRVLSDPELSQCARTDVSPVDVTFYFNVIGCECTEAAISVQKQYDDEGRLVRVYDSDDYVGGSWNYEYEEGNVVRVVSDADNELQTYEYDNQGRLAEECGTNFYTPPASGRDEEPTPILLGCITYSHGDDGSVTSLIPQYDGTTATRVETFTEHGLPLTSAFMAEDGEVLYSFTYVRNERDWILEYETSSSASVLRTVYVYDDEGRVEARESYTGDTLTRVESWSYDELGRVSATARTHHDGSTENCSSQVTYPDESCVPSLGTPDPREGPVTEMMGKLLCF